MARNTPEDVVVEAKAHVGEGPVWWANRLHWVELTLGRLHVTEVSTGADTVTEFGGVLGAVAPSENGPWVAITGNGFAVVNGDQLETLDPVTESPRYRMNDGKCDRAGRFWAGSTAYGFPAGHGALHVWSGAASTRVDTGLTLPNGMGWSPDDAVFYLVDSYQHAIFAYDYCIDDGTVGSRRVLVSFDEADGLPDGLAVDTHGALWVAFHGGGCLRRIDPDGKLMATIPMSVSQPTSCAFGAGTDLYVTSDRTGLNSAQLADQPLAGSVFRLDAGVTGDPVAPFRWS